MSIFDIFKKRPPVEEAEKTPKPEPKPKAERKPRKPRQPKVVKQEEPTAPFSEPAVKVVNLDFDKANPRLGSIELDWNPEFVSFLRSHGYTGGSDEEVVDAWLMDLCKAMSGEVPDMYNVRYIQRRDIGGGKTEFS